MAAKKSKSSFSLRQKIKDIVFSSKGFPIFLSFATLAILFVMFRMKNVESDYKITKTNKDIERVMLDNKELKAKKARLLSSDKLRRLASIHHLDQPKQDQIIVIP
jgi:cell division protein FtsL